MSSYWAWRDGSDFEKAHAISACDEYAAAAEAAEADHAKGHAFGERIYLVAEVGKKLGDPKPVKVVVSVKYCFYPIRV